MEPTTIAKTKIDWAWISRLEGGQRLTGYVPPVGFSGVTIATGIDFGSYKYREDLKGFGCAPETIERIYPYLGLRGIPAQKFVRANKLVITKEEADILDNGAKARIFKRLLHEYTIRSVFINKMLGTIRPQFEDLPAQVQSVIFSMAYNMGPAFFGKAPRASIWIFAQNYLQLELELLHWYPQGSTAPQGLINRRRLEGAKLHEYNNWEGREEVLLDPFKHYGIKKVQMNAHDYWG